MYLFFHYFCFFFHLLWVYRDVNYTSFFTEGGKVASLKHHYII